MEKDIEKYLTCSISNLIYRHPVFLFDDGQTYELEMISEWLENNDTSPITREKIKCFEIKENQLIKQMVDKYLQENTDKEQYSDYDIKKYTKLGKKVIENNNQPIVNNNQPVVNNNQPVADNNQQITNNNRQIASDNQPIANNNQQITNNNQPIANNNQPIVNNNQHIINNNQNLTNNNNQLVANNNQNLTNNNHQITNNNRQITNNNRQITNNNQNLALTVFNRIINEPNTDLNLIRIMKRSELVRMVLTPELVINAGNMIDINGISNRINLPLLISSNYYIELKNIICNKCSSNLFITAIDDFPDYIFKCDFITSGSKIIKTLINNYNYFKFLYIVIVKNLNLMVLESDGQNIFHCIANCNLIYDDILGYQTDFIINQLRKRGDIFVKRMFSNVDNSGNNPLHYISKNTNNYTNTTHHLFRTMLDWSSIDDLMKQNNNHLTPLHFIFKYQPLTIIELVMSKFFPFEHNVIEMFKTMFHFLCKVGTYEKILKYYNIVPMEYIRTIKHEVVDEDNSLFNVNCFQIIYDSTNLTFLEKTTLIFNLNMRLIF